MVLPDAVIFIEHRVVNRLSVFLISDVRIYHIAHLISFHIAQIGVVSSKRALRAMWSM